MLVRFRCAVLFEARGRFVDSIPTSKTVDWPYWRVSALGCEQTRGPQRGSARDPGPASGAYGRVRSDESGQ